VIDTTSQLGPGPKPAESQSAAAFNAARMPGASYAKSFNTLTAAFQEQAARRPKERRVVQWLCCGDDEANGIVAGLIEDAGHEPWTWAALSSALCRRPRPGVVYGEEYLLADTIEVVRAAREGRPIPDTPSNEGV